jgi:hypothetical protein
MHTVVGLFDRYEHAEQAVKLLQDHHFDTQKMGLLGREEALNDGLLEHQSSVGESAGAGALGGAAIGGLVGMLAGLGTLSTVVVPGLGPVIVSGTLMSTLGSTTIGAGVGAAAGGLVGALVDMGVPEEEVYFYEGGIQQGGIVLTVEAENPQRMTEALRLMDEANRISPQRDGDIPPASQREQVEAGRRAVQPNIGDGDGDIPAASQREQVEAAKR